MTQKRALVWLRNDLRIADNPALLAATGRAVSVLAVYIHETDPRLRPIGAASAWWIHNSLDALKRSLGSRGIDLQILQGQAGQLIAELVRARAIDAVYWSRRYDLAGRSIDAEIKMALRDEGVDVQSFNGCLLVEPWQQLTAQNKPYSVFTPFWNALRKKAIATPHPAPAVYAAQPAPRPDASSAQAPNWTTKLTSIWKIGEGAAEDKLSSFLETASGYDTGRDFPDRPATSRLSAHLRFGEIGPRQVWHAALSHAHRYPEHHASVMKFLSELAWREFNYHQLFYRADISQYPMQPRVDVIWRQDEQAFTAWCQGRTGYPLVDAGMRELWQTGYMHNRVRMVAASFLTKNLLLDWRDGERWFWDCLIDADPASNPGNWQWVSGTGLDAAPWFRIFNPVLQSERFDPSGAYIRRWVPELAALPDTWLHRPFAAPTAVLQSAGVILGNTYSHPIVDLAASRRRALDAFSSAADTLED